MNVDTEQLLKQALGDQLPDDKSLSTLLTQMAESDPRAALVSAMLARQNETLDEDTADEEPPRTVEPRRSRNSDSQQQFKKRLRRILRDVASELHELRARNETLSAALGACSQCWGEDPDCPDCRGRGGPGGRDPDEELYQELVLPAQRRFERDPHPTHADRSPEDDDTNGPRGGPSSEHPPLPR